MRTDQFLVEVASDSEGVATTNAGRDVSDFEWKIDGVKADAARQVVGHRRDEAGGKPGGWIGWLKEARQHASKRQDQGKDCSALMGEDEHQTEDCGYCEKAELAVLSAAEKLVEGPEIFRHGHDGYKKSCQKYEDLTKQNADLRRTRRRVFNRTFRYGDKVQ